MRPALAFLLGRNTLLSKVVALAAANGGAVFNSGNIANLSQDTAGATPVAAANDPVGRIVDISGNGFHLTQATSTARPLYQVDAAGYGCLYHDGVDDILKSAASLTLSMPCFLALAVGRSDSSTASILFSLGSNSTNQMGLQAQPSSVGRSRLVSTAHSVITAATAGGFGAGSHVIAGLSVGGTTDVRVDGSTAVTAANAWTTETVPSSFLSTGNSGTATVVAHSFYGAVYLPIDPGVNRALIRTWLGSLLGVAL